MQNQGFKTLVPSLFFLFFFFFVYLFLYFFSLFFMGGWGLVELLLLGEAWLQQFEQAVPGPIAPAKSDLLHNPLESKALLHT